MYLRRVIHRLVAALVLVLAAPACQAPAEMARPDDAGDAGASDGGCQVCAVADRCCGERTANPDSNCQLQATCEKVTGEQRAEVVSGCQDYLRIGSTPPAPAVCGPHPDAY